MNTHPDVQLWHVSDDPDITAFEPRWPPTAQTGVDRPVVWAVDDQHLSNYLFPRECPRVCVRRSAGSAHETAYFERTSVSAVFYIEEGWLERCQRAELWLYRMPNKPFLRIDATAGYYVANESVVPVSNTPLSKPLEELVRRGGELHVVSRLRTVADQVVMTDLPFSVIRLRNALP